jgi:hypothetical protein
MNIININSTMTLTPAQISFIQSILIHGEDDHWAEDDFIHLTQEIPIFLLAAHSMPNITSIGHNRYDEKRNAYTTDLPKFPLDRKPPMEYLGFFDSGYPLLGHPKPIIALCPERIASCVQNDDELLMLTAVVVIHELAHAKIWMDGESHYQPAEDTFSHWMEESMANAMTLRVIKRFDRRHERWARGMGTRPLANTLQRHVGEYAENFMRMQPDPYRLGAELPNRLVSRFWYRWARDKGQLENKTEEKENWLNYVTMHLGNLDSQRLEELYNAIFSKDNAFEIYRRRRAQ